MNIACVYHATLPTSAQFGKKSLKQGNRFKIIFTTEYTEDTEFRFF